MSARMEEERSSNTGSPVSGGHIPTDILRRTGWSVRVTERLVVLWKLGNANGGKESSFESRTEWR